MRLQLNFIFFKVIIIISSAASEVAELKVETGYRRLVVNILLRTRKICMDAAAAGAKLPGKPVTYHLTSSAHTGSLYFFP